MPTTAVEDRHADQPDLPESLLATPPWLRRLGTSAWLAVGVALLVVATVWLLALTRTIVMPVIAASVVAAVASPLVRFLERRHIARGLGAALFLVAMVVLSVGIVGMVLGGITSQLDALRGDLAGAKDTLVSWAADAGIDRQTAATAGDDASSALTDAAGALLQGLGAGLRELSSLAVFLSLSALCLFFLLKDGPTIRHWVEGHMRVPRPMANAMTGRVLQSLRGYFVGVTLVAAFNGVVVGVGALIIGVPLAGTIAVVTFLGAYVPYLGAWSAGAFAVLVALGGAGTEEAIAMTVVQLLANGLLQQLIQPIAYGAALGLHPLAVLIVTIAGGSLFGAAGLILAAPLTAAAAHIAADLSRERAAPA